jgi:hypothetical protein
MSQKREFVDLSFEIIRHEVFPLKTASMSIFNAEICDCISHDDAAFISQLAIDDAKTHSDKLRAIISEARQRSDRRHDYAGCLHAVQEMIQPALKEIRKTEVENQIHSELIIRLAEWIPDVAAFLVSSMSTIDELKTNEKKEKMVQLEQGSAQRLIRLMESVLQLAITRQCACYDPDIVQREIGPVLELCNIIMAGK